MSGRWATAALFVLLLAVGCAERARDGAGSEKAAEATKASPSPKSDDEGVNEADRRDANEAQRLTMGPLSFTPPTGWETWETPEAGLITMFAPERPEWKKAGFRPNLGVRTILHPGVSLERYREMLDETFAQSAEQINAIVAPYVKAVRENDVALKEAGKYTLTPRDVDGAAVLSTTFHGVFELPAGLVATKTYALQYLGPDALYSVALTFPVEAEDEMDAVWKSFEENLRIIRQDNPDAR